MPSLNLSRSYCDTSAGSVAVDELKMQDAKSSFDENSIDRSTTIVANEWTGEIPVWESRFWLCGQCFYTISIIITSNSTGTAKQFSGMNLISISLLRTSERSVSYRATSIWLTCILIASTKNVKYL